MSNKAAISLTTGLEDAEKVTEIVKAKCPNHVEVSHIRGGQPVYYYMISVE